MESWKTGCHVHACVDMLWFSRKSDMPTTSVGMPPYFRDSKQMEGGKDPT
ncbi:MAG: hypothetical protein ABSE63_09190 [Thermoguttaceae bacterium]